MAMSSPANEVEIEDASDSDAGEATPPSLPSVDAGEGLRYLPEKVKRYLIKFDGNAFGFVETYATAKIVVNTLAIRGVKKFERPDRNVFRRDLNDGEVVHVCTQSVGLLYNGGVRRKMTIEMVEIKEIGVVL